MVHLQLYPEAIERIECAIHLDPNYADAHNTLGIALALSGQLSPAIEQYQAALRLRPDLLEAHENLAQTLSAANQPEKAIAAAKQAIKVARSTGNEAAAIQIETLLQQYEMKHKGRPDGQPQLPR